MRAQVKFDGEKFNDYDTFNPNTWKPVVYHIAKIFGINESNLIKDWESGGWIANIQSEEADKYKKICEYLGFILWQDIAVFDNNHNYIYVGYVSEDQPFFVSIDVGYGWTSIYFGGEYDENEDPRKYYSAGAKYLKLYNYILFSYIAGELVFEYHTDDKNKLIQEATNQFDKDADQVAVYNVYTDKEIRLGREDVETN